MRQKINWAAHSAAWAESGLSKAEYCRRNGLNRWSFYHHTKPRTKRRELPLTEVVLPGLPFPSSNNDNDRSIFELHIAYPFRFRFRINLALGGGAE